MNETCTFESFAEYKGFPEYYVDLMVNDKEFKPQRIYDGLLSEMLADYFNELGISPITAAKISLGIIPHEFFENIYRQLYGDACITVMDCPGHPSYGVWIFRDAMPYDEIQQYY